jgi:hypothetical protein
MQESNPGNVKYTLGLKLIYHIMTHQDIPRDYGVALHGILPETILLLYSG